ncbi:MAG TPA: thioredoxin domain-containing protein [Pyrinomonadaceae bacterium]|jgi:protein-disulfide isomerase
MKRYLPFAIITGVLAVAIVAGVSLYRSSQKSQADSAPFSQTGGSGSGRTPLTAVPPQVSVPPGADPPRVRGAAAAKVTIEEFGDYQCPPCGLLFHDLKSVEKEYGDQLRLVFRHNPLPSIHKHALVAARAAEAAGLQDRFWEMHDLIYENQLKWTTAEDVRPIFIQYARDLGLDADRFTRDLDNPEVGARVAADLRRGQAMGVEGTPTLFVNGRQLRPELMTADGLRKVIDFMLGKKAQ